MTNAEYSRVVFAFVLSYTIMFTLGGRLLDRTGTRLGLALAVAVWSLASAAHAFATGTTGLATARFLLGVGEGACFPAATKGAIEWMPAAQRSLAIGFANGGSAFGAVIAPPLIGGVWLLLWLLAFRGLPSNPSPTPNSAQAPAWRNPRLRRLMLARFFFDPVFYFYMFWIPQYLSRERGLSLQEIGALTWIPFFAFGVMNILAGYLSDRLVRHGLAPEKARMSLMLAAALLTPVSWLAAASSTAPLAIALMSLLLMAHGVWIANFITLVGETVPPPPSRPRRRPHRHRRRHCRHALQLSHRPHRRCIRLHPNFSGHLFAVSHRLAHPRQRWLLAPLSP